MKILTDTFKFAWPVFQGWAGSIFQKKRVLKFVTIVLAFLIFNLTICCKSYFKVTTLPMASSESVGGLKDAGKTFIIHYDQQKWVLSNTQMQNNLVTGKLDEYKMPPTFKPVRSNRPNRYFTRPSLNQRFLLNEVHLYLSALPLHENNQVSIPLSSIVKIEIYDKDKGATTGSYILGSVGIAAGVLLVLSVVAVSILISGLAGSVK